MNSFAILWDWSSHAMSPGTISFMEESERRLIVGWFEPVVAGKGS